MRIRLHLNHQPKTAVPINYQYLISSWIYHTLGKSNTTFTTWLHDHGYNLTDTNKRYKLFTFGLLRPQRFKLDFNRQLFICEEGPTTLELSFYVDETIQHFISGLFLDQKFYLGNRNVKGEFQVSNVEVLPKMEFKETTKFRVTSPICVGKIMEGHKYAQYQRPDQLGYDHLIMDNLVRKWVAFNDRQADNQATLSSQSLDFYFKLLTPPDRIKSRKINMLKENKWLEYKAYLFDFELTAPIELLKIGYYAGFGEKNSGLGCGMVKILYS